MSYSVSRWDWPHLDDYVYLHNNYWDDLEEAERVAKEEVKRTGKPCTIANSGYLVRVFTKENIDVSQ